MGINKNIENRSGRTGWEWEGELRGSKGGRPKAGAEGRGKDWTGGDQGKCQGLGVAGGVRTKGKVFKALDPGFLRKPRKPGATQAKE